MTGFKDDKVNGKIGEQIFVEDYLRFLGDIPERCRRGRYLG